MNSYLKEIIRHEIQNILKEDRRSEMISKIRQEAIENGSMMWFISKFDHGLPSDETRAAVIEFGSPQSIYYYARFVDKGPRDDTRNAVLSSPHDSYLYAKFVDKGPRDDTRNAVLSSPLSSCDYARFVDKGPRNDTRSAVLRSPFSSYMYAKYVDKKPRNDTRSASWRDKSAGAEYDRYFGLHYK